MATVAINGLTAVTAPNLDDTSLFEVEDKNGASRKATMAQLRAQINTGAQAFTAGATFAGALSGITSLGTTGAASLSTTSGVVAVGLSAANFAVASGFSKLAVGGNGVILGATSIGASHALSVAQNVDLDASLSNNYISTDFASRYYQTGGTHVFQTAVSGTAGSAITFVTALTIVNAGQLQLGNITATPAGLADGQLWYDGTNFRARLGGATKTFTVT